MTFDSINREQLSPMMRQYCEMKDGYPDHVLFFRVGDFYEMFFDDAVTVSKAIELTLTGKDCGLSERAPMCGVPFHSADVYIKKLVELGFRVAVCEQLTAPSDKGLVVRDIVRVVTPGTLIESSMLHDEVNNYLGCVCMIGGELSVCIADISTGELELNRGLLTERDIIDRLDCCRPAEILLSKDVLDLRGLTAYIKNTLFAAVTLLEDGSISVENNSDKVFAQLDADSFEKLGIPADSVHAACLCGVFSYIADTQRVLAGRFTKLAFRDKNDFLVMDSNARRNLELVETMRSKEKRGSLLWVIDKTKTAMGKRLIRASVEQPLINAVRILERLDAVSTLLRNTVTLYELQELLSGVFDLERLMTRVIYGTATPRDLRAMCATAQKLPAIKEQLSILSSSKLLMSLNEQMSSLEDVATLIDNALEEELPASLKDGGVIRRGFNEKLDELKDIIANTSGHIEALEQHERDRTGIKNLKVGYNRVFGYYFEVTRSFYDLVPEDYIRKQTLTNCERFITQELKSFESTVLGAREKSIALEEEIFVEVRSFAATKLNEVQGTSAAVAQLDMLCSFAAVSIANQYTRPELADDGSIEIRDGRHPVVELMLTDEVYVPNDAYLDLKANRLLILTGPNMSGKSTYMRQVALIVLMTQLGCYVPARYARISLVDKLFTRVGASDDLTAGQSTFMVEMSEVADILKNATKNSLVILDEVGRGTSTIDGVAIATSVAEAICTNRKLGCKTLFATHYHELIALEERLDGVRNFSVAVQKCGDTIRFLRKIVEGGVDDSYGLEVAKLAGIPQKVITRAKAIIAELEKKQAESSEPSSEQLSFGAVSGGDVCSRIRKTNVAELSDAECRALLEELSAMLSSI